MTADSGAEPDVLQDASSGIGSWITCKAAAQLPRYSELAATVNAHELARKLGDELAGRTVARGRGGGARLRAAAFNDASAAEGISAYRGTVGVKNHMGMENRAPPDF